MGPLGLALTVGQAAWATRRHWQAVPAARRERLQALLRQSGGRPSNLSPAERRELSELVRELDLGNIVRQTAMNTAFPRRRFRRRY